RELSDGREPRHVRLALLSYLDLNAAGFLDVPWRLQTLQGRVQHSQVVLQRCFQNFKSERPCRSHPIFLQQPTPVLAHTLQSRPILYANKAIGNHLDSTRHNIKPQRTKNASD